MWFCTWRQDVSHCQDRTAAEETVDRHLAAYNLSRRNGGRKEVVVVAQSDYLRKL
jgi:hypothetical protein